MRLISYFNATAPTHITTLSLHDALPISEQRGLHASRSPSDEDPRSANAVPTPSATTPTPANANVPIGTDRKSTRLNSSHLVISYAVFCLKKNKQLTRANHIRAAGGRAED